MDLTVLMDFPHGSLPKDDSAQSDAILNHASTPQWIKDWDGPFWVEIQNRLEIENYIEAYLRALRSSELSESVMSAMPGETDTQAHEASPNKSSGPSL
jgi:hypothetical protein